MAALLNWRTRAELKSKFKKEERIHRNLVDKALRDPGHQFDFSMFEEENGKFYGLVKCKFIILFL